MLQMIFNPFQQKAPNKACCGFGGGPRFFLLAPNERKDCIRFVGWFSRHIR
jgi:hypothetical protein